MERIVGNNMHHKHMLSDIWNGNGFSTENNKNCNKFMQLLIHTVKKQLTHSYKLLGLQLQKIGKWCKIEGNTYK